MSRVLYRAEGTLFPEATRSHLEFRLFLDRSEPSLEVRFSYAPKLLEDPTAIAALAREGRERFGAGDRDDPKALQNLLTLSFDDVSGFRGAAHRHPADQVLVLGGEGPSPGLTPGPLDRGPLRITLSAHAVLTPQCRYSLSVVSTGGDR